MPRIGTICAWRWVNINSASDLAEVASCRRIDGDLTINVGSAAHIDGLRDLTDLGGDIDIRGRSNLRNVDGLSGLEDWCGENLTLRDSVALEQVDGLSGFRTVRGDLTISDNEGDTDWSGLSGLTEVEGDLTISGNQFGLGFEGLANLTRVRG